MVDFAEATRLKNGMPRSEKTDGGSKSFSIIMAMIPMTMT
jgi:hypothetical protein